MEWTDLIKGALGGSPLGIAMGFALWKMWLKLEAKDAELKALNEQFRQAMLEITHRSDD